MTEINKNSLLYDSLSNSKKYSSNNKLSAFDQFQDSSKKNKRNGNENDNRADKMTFKAKSKPDQFDEYQNDYQQDFQQIHNEPQGKSKKGSGNKSIVQKTRMRVASRNQKNQQTKQAAQRQGRKQAKSVLDNQKDEKEQTRCGKYENEVDKKFGISNMEQLSNDNINRMNEQIREQIKKYNDILTELINKNLIELTSKKKKQVSVDQTIKIIHQQIKNNSKIQQLDLNELKKLENIKVKLQEQENYSQITQTQEIFNLQNVIKEKRKQIYNMKLTVENQAKKLVPSFQNSSKSDNQSEISVLKQKIQVIKKQFQRQSQKIAGLQHRQSQLTSKIQAMGNIEAQSNQIKLSQKTSQQKRKKTQQTKKKYEDLKSFVAKTESLWNTKCIVSAHENEGIKQKIKNIQLQIKNMQSSIKQQHEKSLKILQNPKPKNELNMKMLDKIKLEMNQNTEKTLGQKQMSLSQMKIITKKKQSVQNFSVNSGEGQAAKNLNNDQQKIKSQQSQRNRVWKQQKKQQKLKLENKQKQQNAQITKQQVQKQVKSNQALIEPKQKQTKNAQTIKSSQPAENKNRESIDNEKKEVENKPKFNFLRNKSNSLVGVEQESQKRVAEVKKQQKKQQKVKAQQQKKQQQLVIKPKRFNLNLRQRKSKQQSESYKPSIESESVPKSDLIQAKDMEKVKQKTLDEIPQAQGSEAKKPMNLNLKKKRDGQNRNSLGDNEFMAL